MAVHNIYFPDLSPVPGGILTIGGEEAHHALRVKRVGVGDVVRVCNGRGVAAQARVGDSRKRRDQWEMDLDVMEVEQVVRARPQLTVLAAAPKGDRLEGMIDGMSQVGVGVWSPLLSERTVVEPRQGKLERLERIAIEAMKQCGRAWLLEIGESVGFAAALAGRVVMADASGAPYQRTGAEKMTLLIGPEGGWSEAELAAARVAKVQVARFGVHTMRTETAAVVAAAVVMEVERPG
jgi:16S rRNA (uracil1498-N3)-methyltransferase